MQAALPVMRALVLALGLAVVADARDASAVPEFLPPLEPPAFSPPPRFELANPVPPAFGLDRFAHPEQERMTSSRAFFAGRWGAPSWRILPPLAFGSGEADAPPELPVAMGAAAAPILADDPFRLTLDFLDFAPPKAKKACEKRPIRFARMGGESDVFSLLACDGSLLPDALDRLSVMARPTGTDRPEVPLPDDPAPDGANGEWTPEVKLLHPRVAWLVQQIASAFPWREVYVISGYRRPGAGHSGLHGQGRAIDLFVMNVPNERVYALCRKLPDVGCGYYPNNKFVHVDVRKPGSGHTFWVDDSAPGEPSHYVDSWPGVEASVPRWMLGAD